MSGTPTDDPGIKTHACFGNLWWRSFAVSVYSITGLAHARFTGSYSKLAFVIFLKHLPLSLSR